MSWRLQAALGSRIGSMIESSEIAVDGLMSRRFATTGTPNPFGLTQTTGPARLSIGPRAWEAPDRHAGLLTATEGRTSFPRESILFFL